MGERVREEEEGCGQKARKMGKVIESNRCVDRGA